MPKNARGRDVMHARVALILYVGEEVPTSEITAVIDSLRKQSQVPWFVRIVVHGDIDRRFDTQVVEAISNLQMFCPNVVTMPAQYEETNENLVMATNSLTHKDYDVLVVMGCSAALPKDTFYYLALPYVQQPGLISVDAIAHDDRYKLGFWRSLRARMEANSLIAGSHGMKGVAVLSATRKKAADDNAGYMTVVMWNELVRHKTLEPKLDLYY